jgi:hypothetical protein
LYIVLWAAVAWCACRSFLTSITSRGGLQILHVHPPILFVAREHAKSGIGVDNLLRRRLRIIRSSPLG